MGITIKRFTILLVLLAIGCKTAPPPPPPSQQPKITYTPKYDTKRLVVGMGSCDDQNIPNTFWKSMLDSILPQYYVWLGDAIYQEGADMEVKKAAYEKQLNEDGYGQFAEYVDIEGTWDDHDYGKNDGGSEFTAKKQSQNLFLDFLQVPANDPRRNKNGVYYSTKLEANGVKANLYLLDCRSFRTNLTKSTDPSKRYQPQNHGGMLGEDQWNWLSASLRNNASYSRVHLIATGIQFIAKGHGFEGWYLMPHEQERMMRTLRSQLPKSHIVIFLSGDRHFSELSALYDGYFEYPILDFTSSKLNHPKAGDYSDNAHRISKILQEDNYGRLIIEPNHITIEAVTHDNKTPIRHKIDYF